MSDDPSLYLDPTLICEARIPYRQSPWQVDWACELIDGGILSEGAPSSTAGARRIIDWVHQSFRPAVSGIMLTTKIGLRYGRSRSIDETLRKGFADCVSHSILACFLLRSHGIPARLIGERVFTSLDPFAAPLVLLPNSCVGPFSEGHVWLECHVDGQWQPADAELGLFGVDDWIDKRIANGIRFAAEFYRARMRSFWHFPLVVQLLDREGHPADVLSQRYLIDPVRKRVGDCNVAQRKAMAVWKDGVRYFAEGFDWDAPFPGLRLALQLGRLQRMRRLIRYLLRSDAPR